MAVAVVAGTVVAGGVAGWLARGPAEGPTHAGASTPVLVASAGSIPPAREATSPPAPPSRAPSGRTPAPRAAALATTTQIKAIPTPGHYFRLGANDTLSEVTRRAYGTTKRLSEVLEANPLLDPKRLPPGALVYLPSGTEDVPPAPPPAPPSSLPPLPKPAAKPAPKPPPPTSVAPAGKAPVAPTNAGPSVLGPTTGAPPSTPSPSPAR
jgi:phage tail protein X